MKLRKIAASVAALALGTVSAIASASTFVDTVNNTSQESSVVNVDFGTTTAGSAALGDVVFSDGFATFTDGALYISNSGSVTESPDGGTGSFWSVGTSPAAQTGPGTLTFASGVAYVGFLWGSPDLYNTVTFWSNGTQLASFTGASSGTTAYGQDVSTYFNFYADGSDLVTSVTFASSNNAFETDNFAYTVTAVPEPESYAMMLAGLGLMGFIARRRKKSKAV